MEITAINSAYLSVVAIVNAKLMHELILSGISSLSYAIFLVMPFS